MDTSTILYIRSSGVEPKAVCLPYVYSTKEQLVEEEGRLREEQLNRMRVDAIELTSILYVNKNGAHTRTY